MYAAARTCVPRNRAQHRNRFLEREQRTLALLSGLATLTSKGANDIAQQSNASGLDAALLPFFLPP